MSQQAIRSLKGSNVAENARRGRGKDREEGKIRLQREGKREIERELQKVREEQRGRD